MYQRLDFVERNLLADASSLWEALGPLRQAEYDLAGGMQWKTVKGTDYLIRHWNDPVTKKKGSRSLGARSPKTEQIFRQFSAARDDLQHESERLKPALEEFSAMVKNAGAPTLPFLASRVCQQLHAHGLGQGEVLLLNSGARHVYESAFAVQFDDFPSFEEMAGNELPPESQADLVMTGLDFDIDQAGLADAILRSVRGMERKAPMAFLAVPAAGPLIVSAYTVPHFLDMIASRCNAEMEMLEAIEWALHEPPVRSVVVGHDGLPIMACAPDPRSIIFTAYALAGSARRQSYRLETAAMDLAAVWVAHADEPFLPEHFDVFPQLAEVDGVEAVDHYRI